jgi:hypothetical protein
MESVNLRHAVLLGTLLASPSFAAKAPDPSQACIDCHTAASPSIVEQWRTSAHGKAAVGCLACHRAAAADADAFDHNGETIATIVTPRDCGTCHQREAVEFRDSHHAAAGNILASLDNRLAEIVEGARLPFDPHSATPGRPEMGTVNGLASVASGCRQCHGGKVALLPGREEDGRPKFDPATWPNTGIGRINLDDSRGSCSACHSRHDFSARRARQPENCGKCHLGPDHPQKEIYDESKHGVAFRDLREKMHLDAKRWVLGKDYTQAPTCASCHLSGNANNEGRVTHDPGERISWTNRPVLSLAMDTDTAHRVVTEADPVKRKALIADTWQAKRDRMRDVCTNCHSPRWIDGFYRQYDDLVVLYNEKFGKAGMEIMAALREAKLLTPEEFDEPIEWTWYFLWHHEGRRARHGASMMAPDYTHWHGMYEVANRFYVSFIPEARALARTAGGPAGAKVNAVIDGILARPEHAWGQPSAPTK